MAHLLSEMLECCSTSFSWGSMSSGKARIGGLFIVCLFVVVDFFNRLLIKQVLNSTVIFIKCYVIQDKNSVHDIL